MAFFPPDKLRSRKIEIDRSAVNCNTEQVQKRLERITVNYSALESLLSEVEETIAQDDRLREIDSSIVVAAPKTRKRKWRGRTLAKTTKNQRGKTPRQSAAVTGDKSKVSINKPR